MDVSPHATSSPKSPFESKDNDIEGTYNCIGCGQQCFNSQDKLKVDVDIEAHMFKRFVGDVGYADLPEGIGGMIENMEKNETLKEKVQSVKTVASTSRSIKCLKCNRLIGVFFNSTDNGPYKYYSMKQAMKFVPRI